MLYVSVGQRNQCTIKMTTQSCEVRHFPNREGYASVFTFIWIMNAINSVTVSIFLPMAGLVQASGDIPLNLPQVPGSAREQKASKHREAQCSKHAYNHRIQELKRLFNTEVDSIAREFSRQGMHRSCHQIRKQVLFSMNQPEKKHKPSVYNAWAHTEVQAQQFKCMSVLES